MAEKTIAQPAEKVLITERATAPADDSVLKTPVGSADVQVITMTWYSQVGIRFLRTYLQSLLGFILAVGSGAAGGVGIHIPVGDFGDLLLKSAGLAVAPAVVSLLQNSIEILSRLDVTKPEVRA
jgi:hypothetical protein